MRRHSLKLALVGGATAVVLAGGSAAAVAVASGSPSTGNNGGPATSIRAGSSTVPRLPGAVVDVRLTDMGSAMRARARRSGGYGPMMGGGYGPMMGGAQMMERGGGQMMTGSAVGQMMGSGWRGRMMQVRLSRHSVPAGTVSLRVSDVGVMTHELVVLPLAQGSRVGQRTGGSGGTVDEHGSVGEVSNNGGAGVGEGLHPGGAGWMTLHLRAGRYELVCNLPGHYAAGMFAELDVTK